MNPWSNNWAAGPAYQPFQPQPGAGFVPPGYIRAPYWDGAIQPPSWNPAFYDAPKQNIPRSAKYPNLNPILASDSTPLRFDIRKKPRTEILQSHYYTHRNSTIIDPPVSSIRLISKSFPWAIDINITNTPVTCEMVWDALHTALQEPIADSEWGMMAAVEGRKKKDAIIKAMKKREEGGDTNHGKIKRMDYLGELTIFKGLERDEDFEKMRLLPGDKVVKETWLVKLGS